VETPPTASSCPALAVLQRLLLGQVSDEEAEPLEQHLAKCTHCAELLRAIEARDPLVAALQEARVVAGQLAEGTTVQGLMQQLRALQPSPSTRAMDTSVPDAGQRALPPSADTGLERHAFLAPAEGTGTPDHLGRFQIRRELGRGGFGVVFLAHDPQLRREVALKVPRPDVLVSPELRERFLREARAAAALDHPNVVPVYEAGAVGFVCYIAAAYCPGCTLAQLLVPGDVLVPWREAAQLLATLADAVQHAHSRGVLHRDLKPANILLVRGGGVSGEGSPDTTHHSLLTTHQPKITDFGLAKFLPGAPGVSIPGSQTQSGAVFGTPNYMAPEQAGGHSAEAGPAVDIYALGAILYELLTGRPPFQGATVLDTLEQVRSQEPVSPRRLRRNLPRDLATICLKCLEKVPGKRYATAEDLAGDLRRFLDGGTIQGRPTPLWERGLKRLQRRPELTALVAVCLLASVLLAVNSLASVLLVTVLVSSLVVLTWAFQRETHAKQDLGRALEREQQTAYFQRIALAHRQWLGNNFERAKELLRECPLRLRAWEWYCLERLCHADVVLLRGRNQDFRSVAFSPDGRRLVAASESEDVLIWDETGREILTLAGAGATAVFSPDGERVAVGRKNGTVLIFDASTGGELLSCRGHTGRAWSVAFSPDGTRLASGGQDGTVTLWDVRNGQAIGSVRGHNLPVNQVTFSPDGRRLASGSDDKTVKLWEGTTLRPVRTLEAGVVDGIAFSPDGRRLALAIDEGVLKVWDPAAGRQVLALYGHTANLAAVAFSPDGKRLISAGHDCTVTVWDASTGQEVLALHGHTEGVYGLAFSPDGDRLASASFDGTVRIWDARPVNEKTEPECLRLTGHTDPITTTVFSPDGSCLATASSDHTVRLWDTATGREVRTLRGHTAWVQGVAFSPDGHRLASAGFDQTVRVWDAATAEALFTLTAKAGNFFRVAFSPDGRYLAASSGDYSKFGEVTIWDAGTGQEVHTLRSHTDAVIGLAFSPEGRYLASASYDKTVKIWDLTTQQEVFTLRGHDHNVLAVAFSPDGRRLVSGGKDQTVKVWNTATGKEEFTLRGHTDLVRGVAFSPDGQRLASASHDKTVKLWDATTGQEVRTLRGHTSWVCSVAFSPDGQRLAAASYDKTVTIWVIATPAGSLKLG
jgi:WD40 repeat protein/serine/threonine protein kinase